MTCQPEKSTLAESSFAKRLVCTYVEGSHSKSVRHIWRRSINNFCFLCQRRASGVLLARSLARWILRGKADRRRSRRFTRLREEDEEEDSPPFCSAAAAAAAAATMDDAYLYQSANLLQRRDAEAILREVAAHMDWTTNVRLL